MYTGFDKYNWIKSVSHSSATNLAPVSIRIETWRASCPDVLIYHKSRATYWVIVKSCTFRFLSSIYPNLSVRWRPMATSPTAQCWWCQCPSQTRDHLFKVCPEWKMQQKILWAEVQKETGRWKSRWTVRDLLADGRCGQVVLDFLSSTDVGRLVPPLEEGDARSDVSEWELRERREREEEREAEVEELGAAGELGAREELTLFLPTPSFVASVDEE